MALDTYADLVEAIGGWLKRADLAVRAPDFIELAEARLNRLLRDPDQITTTLVTLSGGSGTLPADFGEMIAFGPAGRRIASVTPGEFLTYNPVAGEPRVYTISGPTIQVLPAQALSSTPLTYYRAIPALGPSTPTNWLLQRAPDVYLRGALLEAEFFGWNDERLPLIKQGWDEAISELRADGVDRRWGAAPLAPRIRRT